MCSTVISELITSCHVDCDGQAYFRPSGVLNVCNKMTSVLKTRRGNITWWKQRALNPGHKYLSYNAPMPASGNIRSEMPVILKPTPYKWPSQGFQSAHPGVATADTQVMTQKATPLGQPGSLPWYLQNNCGKHVTLILVTFGVKW